MTVKSVFRKIFSFFSLKEKQKKIQIFNALKITEPELILHMETELKVLYCKDNDMRSDYILLAGSNNYGFFIHNCPSSREQLITKIADQTHIIRECKFLQWHSQNVNLENSFAPKYFASGIVNSATDIGFVTSKRHQPVTSPSNRAVIDLYYRSQNGMAFFEQKQATSNISPGTVIKDMLIYFVCNTDYKASQDYLNKFLDVRSEKLKINRSEFSWLQSSLLQLYPRVFNKDNSDAIGFIHGDFKPSNMLQDENKRLLLIDFQYYAFGLKEWDLAFYLSKKKLSFNKSIDFIKAFKEKAEQQRFIFLYVLAVLLHPKPQKFAHQYQQNLKPAIIFLQNNKLQK